MDGVNPHTPLLPEIHPLSMHEVSIAESVIRTINGTLEGTEYNSVKEVFVEVGELTFISEEALSYAYTVLTEDSPLKGSVLVITQTEGMVSCDNCGYSGPIKRVDDERWHTSAPILACPKCEGIVDITDGQDIKVKNIKLEVSD